MQVIKKDKASGRTYMTSMSKAIEALEGGKYYKKGVVQKMLKQGFQLHTKFCYYQLALNMRDFNSLH